jgi:hypothetical protein
LVVDEGPIRAAEVLHGETARACQRYQLRVTRRGRVVFDCDIEVFRGLSAADQELPLVQGPESTEIIAVEANKETN